MISVRSDPDHSDDLRDFFASKGIRAARGQPNRQRRLLRPGALVQCGRPRACTVFMDQLTRTPATPALSICQRARLSARRPRRPTLRLEVEGLGVSRTLQPRVMQVLVALGTRPGGGLARRTDPPLLGWAGGRRRRGQALYRSTSQARGPMAQPPFSSRRSAASAIGWPWSPTQWASRLPHRQRPGACLAGDRWALAAAVLLSWPWRSPVGLPWRRRGRPAQGGSAAAGGAERAAQTATWRAGWPTRSAGR